MLVGREHECALIDSLLERAIAGHSSAFVMRGEAGVGKSALLEYAAERAQGMTVTRALGVESEGELEFSGLLDICRPLLAKLDELPERQATALRGALGLEPPAHIDRLAVGAAMLGLLAAAAEEAPLLVLVDDAQWLDRSSIEGLVFATRRLRADRVAVLFAVREEEGEELVAPGVDVMTVSGLDREAATELLTATSQIVPPAVVADRVYAVTRGNPLALLELPSLLTREQLSGAAPLEEPLPVGAAVEQAFARRAALLPERTRRALVVAAVSASTDIEPVDSALRRLGLDTSSLEAAEDAGLVRIADGRAVFRHPLVRSAVFHTARPSERRAAHRALAEGLAGGSRDEERAWHLAAAALGPDEEAAAELAEAARRARERSGFAAAARIFERAARLTPDAERRSARFLEAASAAWVGGDRELGSMLGEEALAARESPRLRAHILRGRGLDAWFDGRSSLASKLLADSAELAEAHDREEAVGAFAEAVDAALSARRREAALVLANRARTLAAEDGGNDDFRAEYALGMALVAVDRSAEGRRHLERVRAMIASGGEPALRGRNLMRAALAADRLGRPLEGLELAVLGVARAREQAAYTLLPHVLETAARLAFGCGRWNEAYAWASEAVELARTGDTRTAVSCLAHLSSIDAARGNEEHCRAHAQEAIEAASGRELEGERERAERALALLDLGLGRLEEAAARYERLSGSADADPDLFEALSRLGRTDELRARAAGATTTDPVAAHCRGLLPDERDFEGSLREAAAHYRTIDDVFRRARVLLALGERLRRAGRRVDARVELREAARLFEQLRAKPWAERALAELRASGETLRRREPHEAEELTPQELQIALQVAEGKTNKEVASALFLSPKTIEFHLKRVYRKLGVRSRGELIRRFATAELVH